MAKPVVPPEVLIAQVEAALEAHAALPAAQLRGVKRHLPALRERLLALGFEVTTTVRRPLAGQLLAALAGGFVPVKGLEKRVLGATAKEVKATLDALVESEQVCEVVRPSGPGVMLASAAGGVVLAQDELASLLRELTAAQRLVKRALAKKKGAKSRACLLPDDLGLARLRERGAVTKERGTGSEDATIKNGELPRAIRARLGEGARPLRVPEVLRALGVSAEDGKRALLEGASAGLYGLEPESGMARLAPDDAAWCPAGPGGTLLSWIVARSDVRDARDARDGSAR